MKSAHERDAVSARKGTRNGTRLCMAKQERNSRIGAGGGGKRDKVAFFWQYQIVCYVLNSLQGAEIGSRKVLVELSQGKLVWPGKETGRGN